MAREYIAVNLGVPLSEVNVYVSHVDVGGQDLASVRSLAAALRDQLRLIEEATSVYSQLVAQELAAAKIPVRDISNVLGVSHQRISQIVNAAVTTSKERREEAIEAARALLEQHTASNQQTDPIVHLGPGRQLAVEIKSGKRPTAEVSPGPITRKSSPKSARTKVSVTTDSKRTKEAGRSAASGRYVGGKAAAEQGQLGKRFGLWMW